MSSGWLTQASASERDALIAKAERARLEYEYCTQRLRQLDVIGTDKTTAGSSTGSLTATLSCNSSTNVQKHSRSESVYLNDHVNSVWYSKPMPMNKSSQSALSPTWGAIPRTVDSHFFPDY